MNAEIDSSGKIIQIIDPVVNLYHQKIEFQSRFMDTTPTGGLTEAQKAMGFTQMWNLVNYNFAYMDRVLGINWESLFYEYYPQVLATKDLVSYYKILQKCVAQLGDGHTNISVPFSYFTPGINLNLVQGKAIIVDFIENNETKKADLKRGLEITKIDNKYIFDIVKTEVSPYYSRSTPQDADDIFNQSLWGLENTTIQLQVKDFDGKFRDVILTRILSANNLPWRYKPSVQSAWHRDSILQVIINNFDSKSTIPIFDSLFTKEIIKSKGLIIDMRECCGGYCPTGFEMISYFVDRSFAAERVKSRRYVPMYASFGVDKAVYQMDTIFIKPRSGTNYERPIVILQGPRTYDASEDFIVSLHSAKRVTLIGEKTAGSTGNAVQCPLPGGGMANICAVQCEYPDGTQFVGVGIIPDITVTRTPTDIITGNDPELKKGIEIISDKIIKK